MKNSKFRFSAQTALSIVNLLIYWATKLYTKPHDMIIYSPFIRHSLTCEYIKLWNTLYSLYSLDTLYSLYSSALASIKELNSNCLCLEIILAADDDTVFSVLLAADLISGLADGPLARWPATSSACKSACESACKSANFTATRSVISTVSAFHSTLRLT